MGVRRYRHPAAWLGSARIPLSTLLLASVVAISAAVPASGGQEMIALSISGPAGAGFSGTCTYGAGAEVETRRLDGHVPFSMEINADHIHCRISTEQRITVEGRKAGNISRTTTSGGTVNLRMD